MKKKVYDVIIVGAGIAGLATAAYLIKDGKISGKNILILEEGKLLGGALDGQYMPSKKGYVLRGYRMFENKVYTSTLDLMSFIPSIKNPKKTLRDEFREFNKKIKVHAKARLVASGNKLDAYHLGLSNKDEINITKFLLTPESVLKDSKIEEHFTPEFFKTNFWIETCTSLAFEPWHHAAELRRYQLRYLHTAKILNLLTMIKSTPYNQYDALVVPLVNWLKNKGVKFKTGCKVTDLNIKSKYVTGIRYYQNKKLKKINVGEKDYAFVTLGSMTANSSHGSMNSAPAKNLKKTGSWQLWENLAKKHKSFGRPSVFNSNIKKSNFQAFTITCKNKLLPKLIEKFTESKPGKGGIITLKDSNWLISFIVPYQPYFKNQKKGTTIMWGYGLFTDKKGNYVKKKMQKCNGKEILKEICYHMGFDKIKDIIKSTVCIPTMLPYTMSQFMPRNTGDRPLVVPKTTKNLAFIGQFCEMPDDVVFTVEYSVRSAQNAVYSLLGIDKQPSPVYHGEHSKKVIMDTIKAALR